MIAPYAFASTPVDITFTGGGTYLNGSVGPYSATIAGIPNVSVICDDFSDNVYSGESWKAYETSVSSGAGTQLSGFAPLTVTQQNQYAQAAFLAIQMTNPSSTCPPGAGGYTCQSWANNIGDIQYAIWQVFDSTAIPSLGWWNGYDKANASAWLAYAQKNAGSYTQYSNVLVYSAVPGSQPYGQGRPQELLRVIKAPEPSAIALLGINLLGLAAAVFFVRRRTALNN